jgi:hypothetical protein
MDSNRGWASIALDRAGLASVRGRLEDATPFLVSGTVRDDQTVCVHSRLYAPSGGYLAGDFKLTGNSGATSRLGSRRPDEVFPGSLDRYRVLAADTFPFLPPEPHEFPITPGEAGRLHLQLTRRDGSPLVDLPAVVTSSGNLRFEDPTSASTLKYYRKTGVFAGNTLLPISRTVKPFSGVFLQPINSGEGVSGKGVKAGSITIEAAATSK